VGVVVDIGDQEKKIGRVRVRIVGYHSDDIPVDFLPWAIPINSNTSNVSGYGHSATGYLVDSWVFGFFYDGHDAQVPIILGSYPGNPGESDINRLARNENISQTCVQKKNDSRVLNTQTALNGSSWNEPESPYNAEYPYNDVYEGTSGLVEEFDDTPGNVRHHLYHPSGTYSEIDNDGTQVEKVVKDKYEIILGNDSIYVRGNVSITVDGNASLLVKGDVKSEVIGNKDEYIHGDYQLLIGGTTNIKSAGRLYMDAPRIDLNKPGPRIKF
jgi:hypothetical protein